MPSGVAVRRSGYALTYRGAPDDAPEGSLFYSELVGLGFVPARGLDPLHRYAVPLPRYAGEVPARISHHASPVRTSHLRIKKSRGNPTAQIHR